MSCTRIKIGNKWLERTFQIDEQQVFSTVSITNQSNQHELLQRIGEEFRFIGYFGISMRLFKCHDFNYVSHEMKMEHDAEVLIVHLTHRSKANVTVNPFAAGQGDELTGTLSVQLEYIAYQHHPVIRKRIKIHNGYPHLLRLQYLTWEDLMLSDRHERRVHYRFFTESADSAIDVMDDSVMAIHWSGEQGVGEQDGLLVATEAPGAMKYMELFKEPNNVKIGYNHREETIFEWVLDTNETFETDYCFLLAYSSKSWEDAVDGELRNFVKCKLTICKPETVPAFTINTWETFRSNLEEDAILENIRIAADMGIEAYQLDCGWYISHGHFVPDSAKFPRGLDPIVEACDKYGMKLGLWMSVPLIHSDAPVAKEHPEWFLLDENGNRAFMNGWKNTEIMCMDSDFKYWIMDEVDRVIKQYHVKLIKLDLVSVRNPYNPNNAVGCHAKGHHHRTRRSSHLGIYRSMFWMMDELRERNPDCLIDLTFELYGVLHNTDLALIQHAHQNWFINADTTWLDNLKRFIHTRSRVVPSYTLNFGSCHLTEKLAKTYGFWSALTSHGLYYGDLRELGDEDFHAYKKWMGWVKAYREKIDFLAYHKVSNTFLVPDAPDHVDLRFSPYALYKAARVSSHAAQWDGVAKLNEEGEGLIIIFRPEHSDVPVQTFPFPWMDPRFTYAINDVLGEMAVGIFPGNYLREGIDLEIREHPGVLVLQVEKQ